MPLKKSSLEQKWYYRVAKVLLMAAPLIAAIVILWVGAVDIAAIKNHFAVAGFQKTLVAQRWNIAIVIGAIAVYYILLSTIWQAITYIIFGGIIDDTKTKQAAGKDMKNKPAIPATTNSNGSNADLIQYLQQQSKQRGEAILWIIFIIAFIVMLAYNGSGSGTRTSTRSNTQTCVPTGCGSSWRSSCTNKCYSTQSSCRASGDACNGNVTCRRCP